MPDLIADLTNDVTRPMSEMFKTMFNPIGNLKSIGSTIMGLFTNPTKTLADTGRSMVSGAFKYMVPLRMLNTLTKHATGRSLEEGILGRTNAREVASEPSTRAETKAVAMTDRAQQSGLNPGEAPSAPNATAPTRAIVTEEGRASRAPTRYEAATERVQQAAANMPSKMTEQRQQVLELRKQLREQAEASRAEAAAPMVKKPSPAELMQSAGAQESPELKEMNRTHQQNVETIQMAEAHAEMQTAMKTAESRTAPVPAASPAGARAQAAEVPAAAERTAAETQATAAAAAPREATPVEQLAREMAAQSSAPSQPGAPGKAAPTVAAGELPERLPASSYMTEANPRVYKEPAPADLIMNASVMPKENKPPKIAVADIMNAAPENKAAVQVASRTEAAAPKTPVNRTAPPPATARGAVLADMNTAPKTKATERITGKAAPVQTETPVTTTAESKLPAAVAGREQVFMPSNLDMGTATAAQTRMRTDRLEMPTPTGGAEGAPGPASQYRPTVAPPPLPTPAPKTIESPGAPKGNGATTMDLNVSKPSLGQVKLTGTADLLINGLPVGELQLELRGD